MIYLPRVILTLVLSANLFSCSSNQKHDPATAGGAYKLAQELEESDRYEEALVKYRQVKAKHPYSEYATKAELAVADLHFKRESYIEAQSAYELFKQFHPTHPRIDYVTYRLAMSYYEQLPSVISRDLSVADKALLYFNETYSAYPNSEYVEPARKKFKEVRKMLADKQMFIADFYFRRERWQSALGRYVNVIKNFSGLGLDAQALRKAALSARKAGQRDKAQTYMAQLLKEHPNSDEAKGIREEIQ